MNRSYGIFQEHWPPELYTDLRRAVAILLGAPVQFSQVYTLVQPVHEGQPDAFQIHVRFLLTRSHAQAPAADRGLIVLTQRVSSGGLSGPIEGDVRWLGRRRRPEEPPGDGDHRLGRDLVTVPGASWRQRLPGDEFEELMISLFELHRGRSTGGA